MLGAVTCCWRVGRPREPALSEAKGSKPNAARDLGLKDADQLLARAQIGLHVFKVLEDKKHKGEPYQQVTFAP
jgi:hypothetical protein